MAAVLIEDSWCHDAVDYAQRFVGLDIETVRIAGGAGPTRLTTASSDRLDFTAGEVGFAMRSHATIPDDKVAVVVAQSAPRGSRWCGRPLSAGSAMLYAPGATHTSTDGAAGMSFTVAVMSCEELGVRADRLGASPGGLAIGKAIPLPPEASGPLTSAMTSARAAAVSGCATSFARAEEHLFDAVLGCAHRRSGGIPAARPPIDRRAVVRACLEYADEVNHIPSLAELCAVANVAERTLRSAFYEQFDCSPNQLMRDLALHRAHERLQRAGPGDSTVTEVAHDVGFHHLGRFASRYRQVFGVNPSDTLNRRTASTVF